MDHTPTVCYEESILELWANEGDFDEDSENTIFNLTTEDIIESINSRNLSGIFLRERNFKNDLGEISYNQSGHIIGAKVATVTWVGKVNLTALNQFGSVQRGDIIDKHTFEMIIPELGNAELEPEQSFSTILKIDETKAGFESR